MQMSIRRWIAALITASAALLSACGGSDDHEPLDIVSLAKSNSNLSILAEAIQAADLEKTLRAAGPFTVFAPTNQAFENLLQNELKVSKTELLANKTLLTSVLTYHVLGTKVMSGDVPPGTTHHHAAKGIFQGRGCRRQFENHRWAQPV